MKLIFLFVITLLTVNVVICQTGVLETMAAILGLLPTSQILLAGGGLIGLKMAIAARILSLLGLVSENNLKMPNQFVDPDKTIKDKTNGTTKYFSPNITKPSNESTTRYFGLPKLDEKFHTKVHDDDRDENREDDVTSGIGNEVLTTTTTNLMEENAFFPIPGLQIDCENSTGICGILHMDTLFPSVFLPSEFANKSGIDYKRFENMSNPMFELFKQEQHGNQSFLFYPLFPTQVISNNMHESGLVSAMNESQLILAHSNGTMVSASDVGEFNFHGFHGLNDETDEELNREKRFTEDNIEMYLTLVNRFDEEGCFSRLICEVGANAQHFGDYGHAVDNLFKNLNQTEFDVTSDAHHYVSHYKFGQINGFDMCGKSSICHQNLTHIIQPLNEL